MAKKNDSEHIDNFHNHDIHIPTRTIFVGSVMVNEEFAESGTDSSMAERLVKNLHILENFNSDPVTIILNNIGGDFYHGMALFDRIALSPCHITIKVFGQCMSMGSAILQAADKRTMSPNATMMIHYGQAGMDTTSKNFQQWAKEFKRTDDLMEKVLFDKIKQKNPDFKIKELKKMLSLDTFFTPEQALNIGLIDAIEGQEDGESGN